MTSQRTLPVLIIFAVLVLTFAACRENPPLTTQEAEGKHLYEVRCAHCHEDNDLALKKVPPSLHAVFKSASLPSGAPAADVEVRHVVLAGKGMMPSFNGRFDDAQMSALLAYLHTGLRQAAR
jgi:mono/diheme cytochrome c family protein